MVNYEKWIDQHDTSVGQRKILSPWQESNPWPHGHLAAEQRELLENKVTMTSTALILVVCYPFRKKISISQNGQKSPKNFLKTAKYKQGDLALLETWILAESPPTHRAELPFVDFFPPNCRICSWDMISLWPNSHTSSIYIPDLTVFVLQEDKRENKAAVNIQEAKEWAFSYPYSQFTNDIIFLVTKLIERDWCFKELHYDERSVLLMSLMGTG